MKASRINTVDGPEEPLRLNLLDRFLKAVTSDMPLVNGSNFFTGEVISGQNFTRPYEAQARNQADWKRIWGNTGHPPPGKLPLGAEAVCLIYEEDGKSVDIVLSQVKRTTRYVGLKWNVTFTPQSEQKKRATFAIVVLPGIRPGDARYLYYNQNLPPPLSSAEIRAKELRADIADFSPALKRSLPAPQPLHIRKPPR